jgi:hypothetical protein
MKKVEVDGISFREVEDYTYKALSLWTAGNESHASKTIYLYEGKFYIEHVFNFQRVGFLKKYAFDTLIDAVEALEKEGFTKRHPIEPSYFAMLVDYR